MVYHGLPWFIMVYHGLPWFTIVKNIIITIKNSKSPRWDADENDESNPAKNPYDSP